MNVTTTKVITEDKGNEQEEGSELFLGHEIQSLLSSVDLKKHLEQSILVPFYFICTRLQE